jgi:hypothetical protein
VTRSQSGLSGLGVVFLIAVAGVAGYYVYKGVTPDHAAESCGSAQNACIKSCRRTSSEAPALQACQEACQREADACKRR